MIIISKIFHFRHYGTNRAPLILGFDAAWLEINKGFTRELANWIRDTLADHSDVYFVTQIQVIYFVSHKAINVVSIQFGITVLFKSIISKYRYK